MIRSFLLCVVIGSLSAWDWAPAPPSFDDQVLEALAAPPDLDFDLELVVAGDEVPTPTVDVAVVGRELDAVPPVVCGARGGRYQRQA